MTALVQSVQATRAFDKAYILVAKTNGNAVKSKMSFPLSVKDDQDGKHFATAGVDDRLTVGSSRAQRGQELGKWLHGVEFSTSTLRASSKFITMRIVGYFSCGLSKLGGEAEQTE